MFLLLLLVLGRVTGARLARRDIKLEVINSEQNKLQFHLSSTNIDKVSYAKARHAIKLAGVFLENVFDFKNQITFLIRLMAPCKENKQCPLGLGATGRNFFNVDTKDNITIMYPQALIKQIPELFVLLNKKDMYMFDIEIDFNWDYDHYFPIDYPTPALASQYDFLHMLLHEINHGMGMTSTFLGFSRVYPKDFQEGSEEPTFNFYHTVFDQYIYDAVTHQPIAATLKSIEPLSTPNRHSRFENITAPFKTKGRIIFLSILGNNITLDSGETVYLSGHPSHLSSDYFRIQDDMMLAQCTGGAGIQDFLFNYPNWHFSPYGPAILDIHATLGYTLKVPDPNRSLQYYYWFKRQSKHEEPFNFTMETY
ncbi:hypothetical protein DSO57_1016612 [Entomophthora muscae]|uniref:Uncharacterized protein n=1 Tax=Entomophthora muscae TaxID=34485 RepID=A0ACC2SHK0_9FUNG|nr:hypothetical protein DSO57_1016612 [Entomophthora muscae]